MSFAIKRLTDRYSLSFGVMKPNRVMGLAPGVVKKTQFFGDCGKSPTVALYRKVQGSRFKVKRKGRYKFFMLYGWADGP
jgi:hypothetical protein